MQTRLISGFIVLLLATPALAQPPDESDWTDMFGERVQISGWLDFTNLVRADDFDGKWDWARNRVQGNLEIDVDLIGPDAGGFFDTFKAYVRLLPSYDFVYVTNDNQFGNDIDPDRKLDYSLSAFGDGEVVRNRFPNTVFPLEVPYRPSGKVRGASRCLNCNLSEGRLASGDTDNFREYPLREAFFDIKKGDLALRLGKQQVVWGKTDFFRLQDVINPVDFGIHSFLDNLEDIRIPQWMVDAIYNFHDIGPVKDVSLELVWNVDKFLPLGLGQAGEPWANIFGEEIKAFNRFFDFLNLGVRSQELPAWTFENTQFGGRIEFLIGRVRASISDYYKFQDLPIFKLVTRYSAANPNPALLGSGLEFCCGVIELRYPRVNILGGSLDWFEEWSQTVWRVEASYSFDEDFVNTRKSNWVDESDVFRASLGIDRITFIRLLNPTSSFFLSWQVFYTHPFSYESNGDTGFLGWRHDVITTFFFLTDYLNNRLQILSFVAFQFNADALAGGFQAEYLLSQHWSVRAGFNAIAGRPHEFDNTPFQIFAAGGATVTENFFGTVRQGFGTDRDRDEIFFGVRYRF